MRQREGTRYTSRREARHSSEGGDISDDVAPPPLRMITPSVPTALSIACRFESLMCTDPAARADQPYLYH